MKNCISKLGMAALVGCIVTMIVFTIPIVAMKEAQIELKLYKEFHKKNEMIYKYTK